MCLPQLSLNDLRHGCKSCCSFGSRSLLCVALQPTSCNSTRHSVAIAARLMALLSGMAKCSLLLPMLVSSLQHGVTPAGISVSKEQKAEAWLPTGASRTICVIDSWKLKQNVNHSVVMRGNESKRRLS